MPIELLISVAPLKSCFISLPLRFATILWDQHADPSNVVVEISPLLAQPRDASTTLKRIYCGWNGGCSQLIRGKETVLIDSVWAKQLGLVQEQSVQISFHSYHSDPTCSPVSQNHYDTIGKQVFVEPLNEDDWEILELNASYLEEQFLNQAKVVYEGEPLTIWLHNQTFINIKIVSIDPAGARFVKLIQDSEIIVSPKERMKQTLVKPKEFKKVESISLIKSAKIINDVDELPFGYIGLCSKQTTMVEGSIVYVQNLDFDLLFPETTSSSTDSAKLQIPLTQLKYFFAIVKNSSSFVDSVFIPNQLASDIHAAANSKLRIVSIDSFPQCSSKTVLVQIQSLTTSALKLTESVKSYLISLKTCIVFSGMQIDTDFGKIQLTLKNNDEKKIPMQSEKSGQDIFHIPDFKILSKKEISSMVFEVHIVQSLQLKIHIPSSREKITQLYGVDELYNDCISYLENLFGLHTLLKLGSPFPGGMLLYGSSGCGKSALIAQLSKQMEEKHGLYLIKINCDEWKWMNTDKIKEKIERLIFKSVWHQPSLLIFEDIDHVVGMEDELTPQSSISSLQTSLLLIDQLGKCLQSHFVLAIYSCKDKATLHPSLFKSHLFGQSNNLKPPNKKQRSQILDGFIGDEIQDKSALELDDLSGSMEGYSVSDLKAIYTQALQKKAIRKMKSTDQCDSTLQKQDFEVVLKTFKPLSLTKAKLEESTVLWQSIGGMKNAKEIIMQTLKWPTKYARIFDSSPLRLRSGILLYGYPGCGKTMLASAVAKECGLNFISIKGPELLNKYIGQSEKSVRDVFERAKSATPCVLFFDEFESIAPRRGHDNSGVTDRVVNQFLTEMDGAEGLKGVYVLAATSRPDLIDPALLRPGRLDKAVLCDIPSEEDRLEVIESIVSSSIEIHPSVSKINLARDMVGFSGADIQGLLYSSQLLAINERLDKKAFSSLVTDSTAIEMDKIMIHGDITENRMREHFSGMFKNRKRDEDRTSNNLESIIVDPSHLKSVMHTTRPSILEAERRRLEGIYKKFSGKGYTPDNVGSKSSYA